MNLEKKWICFLLFFVDEPSGSTERLICHQFLCQCLRVPCEQRRLGFAKREFSFWLFSGIENATLVTVITLIFGYFWAQMPIFFWPFLTYFDSS